ncbi:ribosomal-processing cysteine protease Prp [Caminicella sporogenes]|uniref:ribosomal-processing cysteine protease Prp n=1 Tax=Caminicella sporogenes TaxID=166485 RepID=UPI002540E1EE|nr:ribosomal-processing cysteine protease Prp [Caminicella sporogenes]WIF94432.1 ribosomal-processing cysteine protease Prp [Caminicella sporogenes]
MINIKIKRNLNGCVKSFTVKGHAYADEKGRDIVCASISILAQTAVLALYEVADIDVVYEIEDGYLYCELPEEITEAKREKADVIIATMLIGMKGTKEMYPDYISIQDKEV